MPAVQGDPDTGQIKGGRAARGQEHMTIQVTPPAGERFKAVASRLGVEPMPEDKQNEPVVMIRILREDGGDEVYDLVDLADKLLDKIDAASRADAPD